MLGTYNALLPAARAAARLASRSSAKVRDGLAGRRGLAERLEAIGRACGGRLVWIHSTSVGEYEQARPLAALLGERRPDLEILHTFFSPSGYSYARRLGEAKYVEYVPEDTRDAVRLALEVLRPRALVFMKFDLWPNLVHEAHARGVPVLLLDATLQPRSWRSRWPARRLYAEIYRRLDVISAVSRADAARFRALVPTHPAIHVDGDTRYDQVQRRRAAARRVAIEPRLLEDPRPFTLVAGSTWPADEAILLAAWRAFVLHTNASKQVPAASRLVLVPHEPEARHLDALEARLRRLGLSSVRYSALASGAGLEPVVIVDRVGILAELYAAGDVAYVGGAFGTGVHNLLEPAILGLPVGFGPNHSNAPEAGLLLEARAASVIRSALDLRRVLESDRDPGSRRERGFRARACVEQNLGATERCFARLAGILERTRAEESA